MFVDDNGQFSFTEPLPTNEKNTRLWKQFMEFHEAHPEVFTVFEQEVLKAVNEGREKYSIYIVREEVRWKLRNKYKFSNSFAPYYARIFVEKYPKLRKLFTFRPIKAA
jgi:lipopolysaccharide biosynthesis regulator YciM